jgi:hypothetical protein
MQDDLIDRQLALARDRLDAIGNDFFDVAYKNVWHVRAAHRPNVSNGRILAPIGVDFSASDHADASGRA